MPPGVRNVVTLRLSLQFSRTRMLNLQKPIQAEPNPLITKT